MTQPNGPQRRETDGHGFRSFLDTTGVWVVIAYVILFVVLILGGVTYTRESSDRAARKASEQASYQSCIGSIPILRHFHEFVIGVRGVGNVLLDNSIRMHDVTPPGSPVYRTQAANIERLRAAIDKQRGANVPILTPADCRASARRS